MGIQTGRPVEFSEEDVIQAGQLLRERDPARKITGFALRKIVGGGNPTRLKQVWDEHEATQSITESEPVAELPVEVADEMTKVAKAMQDRLFALATDLNDRAVKAAERRVAEVVRAAGDQRQQAESELADASQAVDELEMLLEEERKKVDSLEKRLNESQAAKQAQAVELATLRERLESVEKASKAAADQHMTDMQQLQTKITEQVHAQQNLIAERDQLKTELTKVQAKAEAAEESHQQQRKMAADEIKRNADKLVKIEGERDNAKAEAGKTREEVAKLNGQLEVMKTQAAQLMQAIGNQQPAKTETPKKD